MIVTLQTRCGCTRDIDIRVNSAFIDVALAVQARCSVNDSSEVKNEPLPIRRFINKGDCVFVEA